jgi:PleD family two-component response regulator
VPGFDIGAVRLNDADDGAPTVGGVLAAFNEAGVVEFGYQAADCRERDLEARSDLADGHRAREQEGKDALVAPGEALAAHEVVALSPKSLHAAHDAPQERHELVQILDRRVIGVRFAEGRRIAIIYLHWDSK